MDREAMNEAIWQNYKLGAYMITGDPSVLFAERPASPFMYDSAIYLEILKGQRYYNMPKSIVSTLPGRIGETMEQQYTFYMRMQQRQMMQMQGMGMGGMGMGMGMGAERPR